MVGGRPAVPSELSGVARIGDCSGVLVRDDVVLTNAHCLERPVDRVVFGETTALVRECASHPLYRSGQAIHDIAFCQLSERVPMTPLAVDDESMGAVARDTPVVIAGYGATSVFAHDSGVLRTVETTVVALREQVVVVGTPLRTACHGDSGAPVLVDRHGRLHVSALIRGSSGAICASAADAVPISANLDWIAATALPPPGRSIAGPVLAGLITAIALVATALRRRHPLRANRDG